ncbi:MAG: hypothetical protein QM728_13980 [Gordonia sp. (in: high G+C Gram-positive bacteria)]|uniref:hypothetical protein n=1 Tax=Gordonia sp. (in: high G+C Gram-positive bacteria) TaxID=84139 RepID=UPI0039E48723
MTPRRMRMIGELTDHNPGAHFDEPGKTLGKYYADFGGTAGEIDDPYGIFRSVSLAAFDGGDPDSYLAIGCFEQRHPGDPFPELRDGQVVLAEYDLPDERPDYLPPVRDA